MILTLALAMALTVPNPVNLRVEVASPVQPVTQLTWRERLIDFLVARRAVRKKLPVGTKLVVHASGYAASPYQTDSTPCITATGTVVRQGVVASNGLPMGTILAIKGEKTMIAMVEDSMHPRYGGQYLDIWFPSTSEAIEFGRRQLEITIVGYGQPGQALASLSPQAPGVPVPIVRSEEDLKPIVGRVARSWWRSMLEKLATKVAGNLNRLDVDCARL